jgi:hypothetical protein
MMTTITASHGLRFISQSDPDFETAIAIMIAIENRSGKISNRFSLRNRIPIFPVKSIHGCFHQGKIFQRPGRSRLKVAGQSLHLHGNKGNPIVIRICSLFGAVDTGLDCGTARVFFAGSPGQAHGFRECCIQEKTGRKDQPGFINTLSPRGSPRM